MARRSWDALSGPYKRRLERAGITQDIYESGAVSLSRARGHGATPEHPERAFRRPDKYGRYLRRRVAKGRQVPEGMITEAPSRRIIGDEIGWPGRHALTVAVFTRSQGGMDSNAHGQINILRANPKTGEFDHVRSIGYKQSDFPRLSRMAKERGFQVQVISVPALGVTA